MHLKGCNKIKKKPFFSLLKMTLKIHVWCQRIFSLCFFLTFALQIQFTVAPFPLRMANNWVDASFRCTVTAAARVKVVCAKFDNLQKIVLAEVPNRRRGAQLFFAPARARLHRQPLITCCKTKYVMSVTTG